MTKLCAMCPCKPTTPQDHPEIIIKTSAERIEFSSDTGFGKLLTNPLKTDNGQTIGERNRAELHARLDAWLDGNFMENT